MFYKGYLIEGEIRVYEFWSLDDYGQLNEYQFTSDNSIADGDIKYAVSDTDGDWQEFFDTLDDAKVFIDNRKEAA